MERLSKEEYFEMLDEVKEGLRNKQDKVEKFLETIGCRIEGEFRLVDRKTNVYMKVRMS